MVTMYFLFFFFTMFGLALFVIGMIHFNYWVPGINFIYLVAYLTSISLFLGTLTAGIVGSKILKPIDTLKKSMKQVADGDFSVKIDENQRVDEVSELCQAFNIMVEGLGSIETLGKDFINNVSHEFRTPIATIQGYVQLLRSKDLSKEECDDYYDRIMEGTQQLSQLAENVLQLTKLDTQPNNQLDFNYYRLDEQIREVILFLEPKWSNKSIGFEIEMEDVWINGNEEMLYQVWLNLVDNAIKYSEPNSEISVELFQKSNVDYVRVTDHGVGIEAKNQKRVFDRFYQEDTSRKMTGNGLGLSLVRKIIDIHEGKILVTSQKNEGTTFEIELPNKELQLQTVS